MQLAPHDAASQATSRVLVSMAVSCNHWISELLTLNSHYMGALRNVVRRLALTVRESAPHLQSQSNPLFRAHPASINCWWPASFTTASHDPAAAAL